MTEKQGPKVYRKTVATFPLPDNEGSVNVSVTTEQSKATWAELLVTKVMYFHNPKGCGGPMRIVHVGDQKTVLTCTGCGLRLELMNRDGHRPARIGTLGAVLSDMCEIASL